MAQNSEGVKTLAACDSCGDAFVARRTTDEQLVPFGDEGCNCGENRLRELN